MERLRRRRPETQLTSQTATERPVSTTSTDAGGGVVQVIWGAMTQQLDLAEMTVRDAHQLLTAPYHIPPGVQALVNGVAVDPDHALGVNDTLEFARAAGEKGGA